MSASDEPVRVEPSRVSLPDITLSVLDIGAGPAVLLLHGFPDRATMWQNQITALARAGYRVIAPDLRGFGDSDRPTDVESYALQRSLGDLRALLRERAVERAAVVGHDYGATLGWLLTMSSPLVSRLAALSVGHPNACRGAGFTQRARSWYMLWFQFPGVAESVLPANDWAVFRQWAHPEAGRADTLVATQIRDLARPGALSAALSWYRANIDPATFLDRTPLELPPVTCPVLGIIGDSDVALGTSQMLDSYLHVDGPFDSIIVTDGDHWLPTRHADTVTERLLAFLNPDRALAFQSGTQPAQPDRHRRTP